MDEEEYLDDDFDVAGDDEEELLDQCGMTREGLCTLAGTEHCDWDCPRNKGGAR